MTLSKKIVTWTFLGLFLVSGFLHFFHLSRPDSVVFDEVHFGKFVTAYCCKFDRIFDIHPPHPKLPIAAAVMIAGYDGNFDFDHIGEAYGNVSQFAFRFVPALEGSLIPPMFFLMLLALGLSGGAALFGAVLLLLDNGLLIQTRIIAMDGLLLLSLISAIYFGLRTVSAPVNRRWGWALAAGTASALAVGSKFTGLTAPGLVFFIYLFAWYRSGLKNWKPQLEVWGPAFASFFFVYIGGWWIHFTVLTNPGYADQFYALKGSFWTDLFNLHESMLRANTGLSATHSDGSRWWQWLYMEKPVYYWVDGKKRIYFEGNPVVWWGSGVGLVLALITFVVKKIQKKKSEVSRPYLWVLPVGYLMAYLPYVGVSRVLFLYHYLPPLFFASGLSVYFLDEMNCFNPQNKKRIWATYIGLSLLVLVGFLLIAPLTYGTEPAAWQLEGFKYLSTIWKSG